MTAFEKGYSAFLRGLGLKENPFDKEKEPYSLGRWQMGWNQAQRDKFK